MGGRDMGGTDDAGILAIMPSLLWGKVHRQPLSLLLTAYLPACLWALQVPPAPPPPATRSARCHPRPSRPAASRLPTSSSRLLPTAL